MGSRSASSRTSASTIAVAAMVAGSSSSASSQAASQAPSQVDAGSSNAAAVSSLKAAPNPIRGLAAPAPKTSHLPLVTVDEIQAGVHKLKHPRNGAAQQVVLGGRSANSVAQVQAIVRQLAKLGRLDEEALLLLAEEDAEIAQETAETVLADLEHSVVAGELGSEHQGQERDVYYGPWRITVVTATLAAEDDSVADSATTLDDSAAASSELAASEEAADTQSKE